MQRILIVDDEEQIRKMLGIMLRNEGYYVEDAADGNAALALLETQSFDLVITDIVMPEKEGLETIMELKKKYPTIKIIAISGGGRVSPVHYLEGAKALGATHVFSKPVKITMLLSAIKQALS